MPQIEVRNWKNEKVRTLDLAFLDYPSKPHLVYEAVCAYQAAGRAGTHKTKNRREVSGGTKKLWKQKHTGRARMGDNRSPLWRHGGTIQGPVPRDYSWNMPKRMRRNALRAVLAEKFRDGQLVCIDRFEIGSHKTKDLESALRDGLGLRGRALLLPLDDEKNLMIAAGNNPNVCVVRVLGVGIVEMLDSATVVASEAALRRLEEVLSQ